jgi:hypothetical protein
MVNCANVRIFLVEESSQGFVLMFHCLNYFSRVRCSGIWLLVMVLVVLMPSRKSIAYVVSQQLDSEGVLG